MALSASIDAMCAGVTIVGADQSGGGRGGGRAVDPGRWIELAHGVTILLTQAVPHGVTILPTGFSHMVTILPTCCTTW